MHTITRRHLSIAVATVAAVLGGWAAAGEGARPALTVKSTADFEVTGDGANAAWEKTEWVPLPKAKPDAPHPYEARFKVLYSETGLYVLMEGTDAELTCAMQADNLHLWEEDVFEVFLWPDETYPLYFEYEISPLNYELPILIPNLGGRFLGWLPWDYEGDRKTRKATSAFGGSKESGAKVDGWRAEFFIPYKLLAPLSKVPPQPGTTWRANFYRIDYDGGRVTYWCWAPIKAHFHEFEKFGTIVFE